MFVEENSEKDSKKPPMPIKKSTIMLLHFMFSKPILTLSELSRNLL